MTVCRDGNVTLIAVVLLILGCAGNRVTTPSAAEICVRQPDPPWFDYSFQTKPDGQQISFLDLRSPQTQILDVFAPLPVRVCVSGGPSNAMGVTLKTSSGTTKDISVREASCTDLFMPSVRLGGGCISANLLCDGIQRIFHCQNNRPDGNPRPGPFWTQGWWAVAANPSTPTALNGEASSTVAFANNPERTIPPAYLLLSEALKTVRICAQGKAIVHISKDPLGATDDAQRVFDGNCDIVQGKAIWVVPEEVNGGHAGNVSFKYLVTR